MSEPRRLGPFDVGKQLGVGGMGIVYLATYRETGQKVALKVLSPSVEADERLVSRFEREIEILKKLDHPNIVKYVGSGRAGTQRYYAMEYMDGGSLDTVLRKRGQLTWEQTIKIGQQLCAALEHAHNHGIIHRDLKPGNLFVTKKGRIRLGDFGIARDTDATALTAAGKTVGTYAYMAPEQIHGKHPIGPRTDIYAMGCLLYQFLTGSVPFNGENAAEMFMQHLNDDPGSVCEKNLDCPIWLERVILKMLEKEPENRPYDALAVLAMLDDVQSKVADQRGMAKHTLSVGAADTVITDKDRTELHSVIRKKKKKRKRKQNVPFWERAWFLAACLGVLIAAVTWAMWPPNEATLFDQITERMKDTAEWTDVQNKEIASYLERFPDGPHADEVAEYSDLIDMDRAKRRAETRFRKGLEPRTEAEARYIQARRYEEFGDRVTALEQYEAIINLFSDKEDQAFVNLARHRIREIQAAPPQERILLVNASLKKAHELERQGESVKAGHIWRSIVRLYASNKELDRQVEYARARLNGDEVPDFDFAADKSE